MKLVAAVQMFKGLGDRTRLRILNLLTAGERTGTEIADTLRVPRGRVARHLRYLYKSRLVSVRHEGVEAYYSLRSASESLRRMVMDSIVPALRQIDRLPEDVRRLKRR